MPRAGVREQLAEYRRKRNFRVTAEPSGDTTRKKPAGRKGRLRFVIQKHRASHLHFDWRLEVDGVMKSWAVPKGPSLDPSVKRLAMQVEDHPIEYNDFEGVIPEGQYGGGTVMLWDRGTYTADEAEDGDDEAAMREGLRRGKLAFTLHGKRLKGSFALVRMKGRDNDGRQWLLLKHRDEDADAARDIVAEVKTSVASGRTMEEIAEKKSRVWQSNRKGTRRRKFLVEEDDGEKAAAPSDPDPAPARRASARAPRAAASLAPMLAKVGDTMPSGDGWTFEPKFDGIRVLAFVTSGAVRLITRNGNDKTRQFPEIAEALRARAAKCRRDFVLDGEVVAIENGEPARFQALQGRMHVRAEDAIEGHRRDSPTALVAFDLLVDGAAVLVHEPWRTRRRHLEKLLGTATDPVIRLAESSEDGRRMLDRASRDGWEGVIAKRTDAPYEPGVRSKSWLKLKLEHRQEFVVGGFTEPRNSREHIGALLVGYYDRGRFIYAGHVGGGFSRASLQDMYRRLGRLEISRSPFSETPKTNEPAHWVRPQVVVEVRFNEWTSDGKLRQPIFLGVRTDKAPTEVGLEPESVQAAKHREAAASGNSRSTARRGRRRGAAPARGHVPATPKSARRPSAAAAANAAATSAADQLAALAGSNGGGTLHLDGATLEVTNLNKVYFPQDGITKGDLLRYYATVSPALLPAIADRPLVLKRYPNGIEGKSFFQQKAPDAVPDGVRVETIESDEGEKQRRIVGGDLPTLLYVIQLGAISIDPWHARIGNLDAADYSVIDLDPGPRAPFKRVVEVAHLVREELEALKLRAIAKTSGSRGMHIVIPLEPETPAEAALLVAQLIATRVAERSPKVATIERSVKARPPAAIYVDFLQNIRGKSVAAVYAARARPGATVSVPLDWDEVEPALDPREFTIETVPARLEKVGDLWGEASRRPNSLRNLQ